MLGSRRRKASSTQPLNASNANPNAATAALSAFNSMNHRESSQSLSSAAAAAALRARPTTPTSVAAVETKRTARRSASQSSHGSADGRRQPALQRRGSSGSMTERTFRSPSPGPSSNRQNGHSYANSMSATDAPPVPSIPKHVAAKDQSHRRATSLQTTPFRVASQKKPQGTWFGTPGGDSSNVRTSDAAIAGSPSSPTLDRPDSRSSSVNFSYPSRVRVGSPPASPIGHEPPQLPEPRMRQRPASVSSSVRSGRQGPRSTGSSADVQPMVYDPNSRRMVPRAIQEAVESRTRNAAGKPVKKKKMQSPKSGSHLAQGTMGRTKGTAVVEAGTTEPTSSPSRLPEVAHPAPLDREVAHELEDPGHQREESVDTEEEPEEPSTPESQTYTSSLRRPKEHSLGKRPSVVREEPEQEDEPSSQRPQPTLITDALEPSPTKQTVQPQSAGELQVQTQGLSRGKDASPVELPGDYDQGESSRSRERKAVAFGSRSDSVRKERELSNSPARQAHFAPTHEASLTVRHSPPPRSVSPRKSALKRQSPTRDGSLSNEEAVNETGAIQDSQQPSRKKSVRVSFDDENTVVVGQAATAEAQEPPEAARIPSPQNQKRPWYSHIGRSKKKDMTPLDDDEVMKPRPALPSFGSVREKRNKSPDERPLVRPTETEASQTPSPPGSPALTPSIPETAEGPGLQGSSSDQAIGGILAQDQGHRNEANISKFREPLPPVVTSAEPHEYSFDTSSSSDSDDDGPIATQATEVSNLSDVSVSPVKTGEQALNGSTITEESNQNLRPVGGLNDVPVIALTHPSSTSVDRLPEQGNPETKVQGKSGADPSYAMIPGGFPDDESDAASVRHGSAPTGKYATYPEVIFEPEVQKADAVATPHTPATVLATEPLVAEDTDDSDDSAMFSDAYEDLSDIEGDGFQSLDAVVESPVVAEKPALKAEDKPEDTKSPTPAEHHGAVQTEADSTAPATESPPPPNQTNSWELAKAYWRSLTVEKRAQLEKEAMDDAGTDGDGEEAQPAPQKTKKNVKRKSAEAQPVAQPRSKQDANPDRVYMIQPGSKASHDNNYSPTTRTTMHRTTMRSQAQQPDQAAAPAPGKMRKSMRPKAATQAVETPRQARPPTAQVARPASYQAPAVSNEKPKRRNRASSLDASNSATAMAVAIAPALKRQDSGDSASSFQRARPNRSEGGFGFRRTMRQSAPTASEPPDSPRSNTARFSLRSLSPPGSPFRRGSYTASPPPPTNGGSMTGRTLRNGNDTKQGKSSLHMPHFGRSDKKAAGKNNKFRSRLDDSDSDDDRPALGFSSRFDDSSDDDIASAASVPRNGMAKTMRAARQTHASAPPRHTPVPEAEESPELPDSSDEEQPGQQTASLNGSRRLPKTRDGAAGAKTPQRSGSGRGVLTPLPAAAANIDSNGPGRPAAARRSSWLGALRRRKADEGGKIGRRQLSESAARQDTSLERSTEQLSSLRSPSGSQRRSGTPSSPRLQKKQRGGSWPLPEAGAAEGETASETAREVARPSTSGGPAANGGARPAMLGSRNNSHGDVLDNVDEEDGGEGRKKKKFAALRRMFRLDN